MGKRVEFKVVGLTFIDAYPTNVQSLELLVTEAQVDALGWSSDAVDRPVDVVLIRNPENEFDRNAIEVHIPLLGRRSMIGHVPRLLAEKLSPSLDRGDVWESRVLSVLVSDENPDLPGVEVLLERMAQAAA